MSAVQAEQDYVLVRDGLKDVPQTDALQEVNDKPTYDYLLSMPASQVSLNVTNLLPPQIRLPTGPLALRTLSLSGARPWRRSSPPP